MTDYVYVEVREGGRGQGGRVSFGHVPVTARSETDAYRKGTVAMADVNKQMMVTKADHGHHEGRFMNDYVIRVNDR